MMRISALALLVFGLASDVRPQTPPSFQISVSVNLVVLHATVRDKKGQFASDLHQQDFQVFQDGVLQTIRLFQHEDVPVTVGLVIDHSGSMRRKLPDVTAAARSFALSSNPQDQMFVVNFNEGITLGLAAGKQFTNRPEEIEAAILKAPATGQTALYDATAVALDRLRGGVGDKKVLIVISDGGDNASGHTLDDVLTLAEQSNAIVYTIGIFEEDDPDRNPDVLRRLARATGGEAYFPRQLSEVVPICERIARDIRHQYTIGYVSSVAAPAGTYRAIRVVAQAAGMGKLSVRTRAGYLTEAPK